MEDSLVSAIEKIKREEQNKEAQLKAKRERETVKASTEKAIRESILQVKKLQQENIELIKKTDELRAQVTIQKLRRDALSLQLNASKQQFEELNATLELAISEIQQQRTKFCETVQTISDECDIWALLTKPSTEPMSELLLSKTRVVDTKVSEINEQVKINEARIKSAMERREKAIAERDRLKSEPDIGEEFLRIRNALRYSLEMAANLQK